MPEQFDMPFSGAASNFLNAFNQARAAKSAREEKAALAKRYEDETAYKRKIDDRNYELELMKLRQADRQAQEKLRKPTDLSAEESKTLANSTASARGLADVGKSFAEKGIDNPVGPDFVARWAKAMPIIGQGGMLSGPLNAMMPKTTQFLNQSRQQVEMDLRNATGATAPEEEVNTYMSFMPQIGDSKELAASKLEDYYRKISNKAEGVAAAHQASGDEIGAQRIRENMARLLSQSGLPNTIQGLKGKKGMQGQGWKIISEE